LDYYQYHGINNEKKPFIGITMGDPAGIGPEIAVKVFNQLIPEE
jgi:4-hydroxy-L-threonine phosphate dehydrogenase PdxA